MYNYLTISIKSIDLIDMVYAEQYWWKDCFMLHLKC
jgi:hypothetical protein